MGVTNLVILTSSYCTVKICHQQSYEVKNRQQLNQEEMNETRHDRINDPQSSQFLCVTFHFKVNLMRVRIRDRPAKSDFFFSVWVY